MSKRKVLVVDDSLLARMAVKKHINAEAFEIYEANDGAKGVALYKEIMPDFVFLDLTMPVMDGFKALEEIKKINPNALVVVLTADIQIKTTEKIMELGAYKVLKKPPVKEEIENTIKEIINILERV
ncbi:MAG: response regulator [Thermodesulfovibrionales bacterium]|nr:response regulator [Thermodesulfovibrionales bacterium]